MATPLREKVVNNSAAYLRPGEQVQGAFSGQTLSGWWFLLTWLMFFKLNYRAVIVTDQRILILDTGKWSATKPKGVVAELPRNVVIGPPSGLWWKCLTLGEKLYVHKRFHKDVIAADEMLARSGMPVQQIPSGGQQPPQQARYGGQQYAAAQSHQPQQSPYQHNQPPYAAQQPPQQQWNPGAPAQQWQQPAPQQPAPPQSASPQGGPQQGGPAQQGQPSHPGFEQPADDRTRIRRIDPKD